MFGTTPTIQNKNPIKILFRRSEKKPAWFQIEMDKIIPPKGVALQRRATTKENVERKEREEMARREALRLEKEREEEARRRKCDFKLVCNEHFLYRLDITFYFDTIEKRKREHTLSLPLWICKTL